MTTRRSRRARRASSPSRLPCGTALLAGLSDPAALVDDVGRLIHGNEALWRALGLDATGARAFLSRPLAACLGERFGIPLKKLEAELATMLSGARSSVRVELEVRRDGTTQWYHASSGCWASGGALGALVLLRDVTAERARERALEGQLPMLQVLLDAIPGPVYYKDEHGYYRGCNRAYEQFIGVPRERIIGATVDIMGPKELADKYRAMDLALMKQRGVQIYEVAARYADGTIHDVMFHKATFDHQDGSVAGIVGVMLDITQRKQAESALRRSEEELREQRSILEQQNRRLSAPIIELGAGVLALPIVGDLDSDRAAIVMERLLDRVAASGARHIFLDVTGLEATIDERTADHLVRLVHAARLLGARCCLTGVGPVMARSLVSLGIDLGGIETYRTLRHALDTRLNARLDGGR